MLPKNVVRLVAVLWLALSCTQVQAQSRPWIHFDLTQSTEALRAALTPLFEAANRNDDTALALDSTDQADDERRLRRLREDVLSALATEGYFTAQVLTLEADASDRVRYTMRIDPGRRATIHSVALVVHGALEHERQRRDALVAQWGLPVGAGFRDADWTRAKAQWLALVQSKDYAAAKIVNSSAQVDADAGQVQLHIEVDSGPAFRFGALHITGLKHYDRALVERFNPPQVGEPYDAQVLAEFQRRLQSSPYFAAAVLVVEPDLAQDPTLPLRLELTEAQRKRVQFGLGYSTNTGPRVETTYRQAQLFDYPYTLHAGAGADRTRSILYADVLLPPKPSGALDSVGVLFERTHIEDVLTHRWGAGAARTKVQDSAEASIETKFSVNLQRELRRFTDAPDLPGDINDTLAGTWLWTRRAVDDLTDPRRGNVWSVSLGAGVGRDVVQSLTSSVFTRAWSRLSLYLPVPGLERKRNVLIARAELGRVFTDEAQHVPSEYLFRTGGAGSVRGYAYQSIGRPPGSARAGSTALAVASLEAVHWVSSEWGGAVFVDVGDAADNFDRMRHPGRAAGLGARWKTLAGPIALDLAWGERRPDGNGGRWRLNFSVAIAF